MTITSRDYYKQKYGPVILVVPDGTSGKVMYVRPVVMAILALLLAAILLRRFLARSSHAQQAAIAASEPAGQAKFVQQVRDEYLDI